jgi:preprotein translocase subunit SecG
MSVLLIILFVLVCLLLIFMVVITPSQEGGIAAAFGGLGSDTFFGTKAHQHINKFTVFLAVAFLVLAVLINRANVGKSGAGPSELEKKIQQLPPEGGATPPAVPLPPSSPR